MIISLQDAQAIDPQATQGLLDSFESTIRQMTHNNFQVSSVRAWGVTVDGTTVTFNRDDLTAALRAGDTVEINSGGVNNGLYAVESVASGTITLDREPRLAGHHPSAIVTLVEYPADVREGVRKLVEYNKKMAAKVGIKSETISRMSTTYYDANSSETMSGYPVSLMSFIKKHTKMQWG